MNFRSINIMVKKRSCFILLFLVTAIVSITAQENIDLLKYVNTLQGTNSKPDYSNGNTYPTVAVPYPVHSFSPQTGENGHGWKYQYSAKTIRGFQQVHQCSPWVRDYGTFALMPEIGKLVVNQHGRATGFSHDNEIAKPNYYKVELDNGITAEMAPVERGGHMRFTFPGDEKAYIVLDGYIGKSMIKIIPEENRIIGWVKNGFEFLQPDNFKSFFILQFDQPFVSYGTWENRKDSITYGNLSDEGEGIGAFIEFKPGTTVQVKNATSYISFEQAQVSYDREIDHFKTLDDTKEEAARLWNDLLNRMQVEGNSEADKATFYSCLFRSNLFSHKFYEIDKNGNPWYFSPYDGKIHEGYMYTDNGFWDTFRSQFPLTNILHPTMQGRYMQSLLDAQEQCDWFPTWSFPGMSGIMIGNHAISLLVDAWAKGIRNFDPEQTLDAYYHEITNKGFFGGSNGREGYEEYFKLGYIAKEKSGDCAAKTLEYAYDDFCAYNLARMTGNEHYMKIYGDLMYNYKNVWDAEVGFMRGRKVNGDWYPEDFSPYQWKDPFTEGNSWQYTWSVFHDVNGLIDLMGGEDNFIAKLDTFFYGSNEYIVTDGNVIHEITEMLDAGMGQYAHGNQPCQHVPYLYSFAGQPWKTQERVRMVMSQLYNATENGYPGDEDQGGLSSWYVLNALGIYSVCPGTDQYVLGSPLFEKATIKLENGNTFTIVAKNNSEKNIYIKSATLNGKKLKKNWITYSDIAKGGTLCYEMDDKPNMKRGTKKADRPYSVSLDNK